MNDSVDAQLRRYRDVRSQLEAQVLPHASSLDGRSFSFQTPVAQPLQPGAYVMLAISDTGVGMSAQTKAHLFEPFYTTKDRGRGTGLGLYIARELAERMGGTLSVGSAPGGGTAFVLTLPRP